MKTDKERGFYPKFRVERIDGRSQKGEKHHGCEYFVLDMTHDKYAKETFKRYAELCKEEYPELSKDIYKKIGVEPAIPGNSALVPAELSKEDVFFFQDLEPLAVGSDIPDYWKKIFKHFLQKQEPVPPLPIEFSKTVEEIYSKKPIESEALDEGEVYIRKSLLSVIEITKQSLKKAKEANKLLKKEIVDTPFHHAFQKMKAENKKLNDPNFVRIPVELSEDDWKKLAPPSSHSALYASPRFYGELVKYFQQKQDTEPTTKCWSCKTIFNAGENDDICPNCKVCCEDESLYDKQETET